MIKWVHITRLFQASKLKNPQPCLFPVDATFPVTAPCVLLLLQVLAMGLFFLQVLLLRASLALQYFALCSAALNLKHASLFLLFERESVEATREPALYWVFAKLIKCCFMSLNCLCTPKLRRVMIRAFQHHGSERRVRRLLACILQIQCQGPRSEFCENCAVFLQGYSTLQPHLAS